MPIENFLKSIGLAALMFAAVCQAKEGPSLTAVDVVKQLQLTLIDIMKRGDMLGYDGRSKVLDKAVRESHAVATISKIVLGKRWKTLSEDQKKEFKEIFTRLSIATYAHNFDSYSGESFKFISETDTARGGKIIKTVFIESTGKQIQFDYLMRKQSNRWWIVNIIADGVSDLALKRSDYTNLLEKEGFQSLLEKLQEKTERYAKADSS